MTGKRSLAAVFFSTGMLFAQASPAGPGAKIANHLDRIGIILNMSDDQKAQVKTIAENALTQAKPLFPQMKQNRQALEQLVKSGATGAALQTQLQALANTQASLTSQLTIIHVTEMSLVWNLLTPDQQQRAAQLHQLLGPGLLGRGMGVAPIDRGPQ